MSTTGSWVVSKVSVGAGVRAAVRASAGARCRDPCQVANELERAVELHGEEQRVGAGNVAELADVTEPVISCSPTICVCAAVEPVRAVGDLEQEVRRRGAAGTEAATPARVVTARSRAPRSFPT